MQSPCGLPRPAANSQRGAHETDQAPADEGRDGPPMAVAGARAHHEQQLALIADWLASLPASRTGGGRLARGRREGRT